MQATASQPRPVPAPTGAATGAPLPGRDPVSGGSATPTRVLLRRWRAAAVVVCVVAGLFATLAAAGTVSATGAIHDNTGPVMVASQSLSASLAEADAAANAAFLTDPEDPRLRNAYLDALDRATAQVEQVSSLIGDDPAAHAALRDVSELITRYAGLVEAARATETLAQQATSSGDEPGPITVEAAVPYLVEAGEVATVAIGQATERLETATLARLESDAGSQASAVTPAVVALVLALLALVGAQVVLFSRTRRILNVGLVLATVLVLAAAVWLGTATGRAVEALDAARSDGFESIQTTSDVQSAAFAAKSAYSASLITGDRGVVQRATEAGELVMPVRPDAAMIAAVRDGGEPACPRSCLLLDLAALSDNAREDALVAEALARWAAFDTAVTDLLAAGSSLEDAQAVALATGPVQETFNGFNFALEGVLAANQEQFLGGLDHANDALGGLLPVVLLAPLIAAGAAWAGMQARVNEYR